MTYKDIANRLDAQLLPLVERKTKWLCENLNGYHSDDYEIVSLWIEHFNNRDAIGIGKDTIHELLQDFNKLYKHLSQ